MPTVTWEPQPDGYKCMSGADLVCRLHTNERYEERVVQDAPGAPGGNHVNSVVKWKSLPPEAWVVHWASGQMTLELVRAAVASLPSIASADLPKPA